MSQEELPYQGCGGDFHVWLTHKPTDGFAAMPGLFVAPNGWF
jgi:hypothetical protein